MYNKVKDWHERVRFGFLQYPLKKPPTMQIKVYQREGKKR